MTVVSELTSQFGVAAACQSLAVPRSSFYMRVKGGVKVLYRGEWAKLNTIRFEGNARRRSLWRMECCQRSPRGLWVTISRARNKTGKWSI